MGFALRAARAILLRALSVSVVILVFIAVAHAVEPSEMLKDPALEARARNIGKELRCLVCQNESIDDSAAALAHDLRVLLRERLSAGDSDRQAVQYIVDRYGQFVLLRPPVEPATYALWYGPFGLLLLAAAGVVFYLWRRPRAIAAPTPLSDDERQRLSELLREGDA
jgi:cytochrome c-type biogenesis protein CcmH